MTPPKKILIPSDNNEASLVKIVIVKTVKQYIYKFTKSKTKLNTLMELSEPMLEKMLRNETFKTIE